MWARNCPVILHKFRLPRKFRDLLHAANLHGTDGFTSPPKEGVLRIFFRKSYQPKKKTASISLHGCCMFHPNFLYLIILTVLGKESNSWSSDWCNCQRISVPPVHFLKFFYLTPLFSPLAKQRTLSLLILWILSLLTSKLQNICWIRENWLKNPYSWESLT